LVGFAAAAFLPPETKGSQKRCYEQIALNAPLTHLRKNICLFKELRSAMMNDLTRGERLQIMLTKEELEALDSWRFSRRMPSRAAAIRELLKRGLSADGFANADGGSRSQDFGVTGRSTASGKNKNGDGTPGE
jgi:hypothetical protein